MQMFKYQNCRVQFLFSRFGSIEKKACDLNLQMHYMKKITFNHNKTVLIYKYKQIAKPKKSCSVIFLLFLSF